MRTEERSRSRSAGRRLSAITLDQAIAGGSNLLVALLAARLLGADSFGLFALLFQLYVVAQGVARGLVGEPLLVRPKEATERPSDAIGTALAVGVGVGMLLLVSAAVAAVWSAELALALVVLAVFAPLLVLQDVGRYLAFALHRPERALVLDAAWLALMLVGAVALVWADAQSLVWFVAVWAGAGGGAGLLLLRYHPGVRPRLDLGWLRDSWNLSSRYLMSYLTSQGAVLAASLVLGAVAGTRALAAVRGAQLLVRPYATFETAAIAATVAEISRVADQPEQVSRHVSRTTGLTVILAVLNGCALLLLPDQVGRLLLGDTWQYAEPLMLVTALSILFLGMVSGARAGLLGQRAIGWVLAVDLVFFPVVLVASALGAAQSGALGYCWAITLLQGAAVGPWWWVLRRRRTHQPRSVTSDATSAAR